MTYIVTTSDGARLGPFDLGALLAYLRPLLQTGVAVTITPEGK